MNRPAPRSPAPATATAVRTTTAPRRLAPRVVLLGDHALLAESLAFALGSRGFEVVTVPWPDGGSPGVEVRQRMLQVQARAGILLGDLRTPERIGDARELLRDVPLRWLLVVAEPHDVGWGLLVEAGASAVLPTSISLDRLARSLVQAMAGSELMHREARDQLIDEWRAREDARASLLERFSSLSPRESLVLDRLYDGTSVKIIAELDGVSMATVRTQVKAILRKLDVSSQLAAVAEYRRVRADGAPPPPRTR